MAKDLGNKTRVNMVDLDTAIATMEDAEKMVRDLYENSGRRREFALAYRRLRSANTRLNRVYSENYGIEKTD